MMRRSRASVVAFSVVLVAAGLATGPAGANNQVAFDDGAFVIEDGHRHDSVVGSLDVNSRNVTLVGRGQVANARPGLVSDVGVLDNHAYLGAFNSTPCEGGVYVMDISDLTNPHQVGFIAASSGSFVGEGVHPMYVNTASFNGSLLSYSNEVCTNQPSPPAVGGATLVDISDPLHPVVLINGFGAVEPGVTTRARQVHSTFMWQVGHGNNAKAYIVLPDSRTPMLPIFDITDPRNPVQVIDINLAQMFPQILQTGVGLDSVFFHDVVVRRHGNRQIMLLSFWDAGYVMLDVTDPAHPQYIADSDYQLTDPLLRENTGESLTPEGNGHYAEFVHNGQFIITTDEDFAPTRVLVTTDDGGEFRAAQAGAGQLPTGGSVSGRAHFVGLACDAATTPAPPPTGGPWIAVVERGVCTFTVKAGIIESKGYAGTVVFNRTGGAGAGGCNAQFGATVVANKPFFTVPRQAGLSMIDADGGYNEAACQASSATHPEPADPEARKGDTLTLKASFDGWGYVHLYRNNGGKLQELDTYSIREGMDPAYASGFGSLSVHEVAVSSKNPHLAYLSYYDGGFRVISTKNGRITEVGHFVDGAGNDFWGVQVIRRGGNEYVLASDRNFGLYIFDYTGKN